MNENEFNSAANSVRSVLKKGPMLTGIIIVVAVLFVMILKPWVQIEAGERGIVSNFGAVQKEVLGEGIHFRVPMMQKITIMDVKVQKATTDATAASSNLQDVS